MSKKKIFSIIGMVLTGIIVALTAYVVISVIVANVQGKDVSLFGYSFGIVQTDSMEPEICINDLIVFCHSNIDEVGVGENIVFTAGSEFGVLEGESIVHKVVEIRHEDGRLLVFTKGVNRDLPDPNPVTADNFVGECIYHSSALGGFFIFMRNYGVIILIAVIAIPFIVGQIIKIVRLSRGQSRSDGTDGGSGDE